MKAKKALKIIGRISRVTAIFISILTGGFIFHEFSTYGMGWLGIFYILPVFIGSSTLAIVIPSKRKFGEIPKYFSSLISWVFALVLTCVTIFLYNTFRNLSPVIYAGKFYWDDGVYMEFRQNGTFKVLNQGMLGGFVSYGDYTIYDSTIILEDEVRWANVKLNDTLKITETGIDFTLETPHRDLKAGTLDFKIK